MKGVAVTHPGWRIRLACRVVAPEGSNLRFWRWFKCEAMEFTSSTNNNVRLTKVTTGTPVSTDAIKRVSGLAGTRDLVFALYRYNPSEGTLDRSEDRI